MQYFHVASHYILKYVILIQTYWGNADIWNNRESEGKKSYLWLGAILKEISFLDVTWDWKVMKDASIETL